MLRSGDPVDSLSKSLNKDAEMEHSVDSQSKSLNEDAEMEDPVNAQSKSLHEDAEMEEEDYSLRFDDSTEKLDESPSKNVDTEKTLSDKCTTDSEIDLIKKSGNLDVIAQIVVDG